MLIHAAAKLVLKNTDAVKLVMNANAVIDVNNCLVFIFPPFLKMYVFFARTRE
jgi:hypothetical protein